MTDRKTSQPRDIPQPATKWHVSPISEEKAQKTTSSVDIANLSRKMNTLTVEEPLRRRSQSVPLSLEASGIASKLRLLSDTFQGSYEKRHKRRRITIGSGKIENKRRSWPAWNPQIDEEIGDEAVFQYSSSLPSSAGTSV